MTPAGDRTQSHHWSTDTAAYFAGNLAGLGVPTFQEFPVVDFSQVVAPPLSVAKYLLDEFRRGQRDGLTLTNEEED